MNSEPSPDGHTAIAIVGMACRFPGARDVDQYWRNIRDGVESITHFADEELLAAGVTAEALADPTYVKASPALEGIELFDAGFFGFTPAEARICDPQQRLFLEVAWTALEAANCDPSRFPGAIGVFAGSALSTYLLNNLAPHRDLARWASPMQVVLGNDKDSLSTRIAYAFDLRGPCYGVQSYCSSSLVAVAAACTSLVAGECDTALAGGVAVSVPQRVGYSYQQGGIASPDGRCRAFDADAKGAPLGNGVGVVVLKRLADAVADGDHVHAVISGWAVNNDGSRKVGYTAPGVRGQADVISEALANADVDPARIDYVEAHGTGTALGDAAEFAAMMAVFGEVGDRGSCALGSVKTNIGHLDRAAGVAGLIKTALALEHRQLPPTLHFRTPNPQIDFANSPFRVQTELADWARRGHLRRAGVSAFGIGGTNAHVVLQEAPPVLTAKVPPRPELLVLSARTPAALDARIRTLAEALDADPDLDLADVAHTLQVGRQEFEHRCAVVVTDRDDAVQVLRDPGSPRLLRGTDPVPVDRPAYHDGAHRRRVPLPTYPFQRQRYWVDPPPEAAAEPQPAERTAGERFQVPSWQQADAAPAGGSSTQVAPTGPVLLFIDDPAEPVTPGPHLAAVLADRLAAGGRCITVRPGAGFAEPAEDTFVVRPAQPDDYDQLAGRLAAMGCLPATVVHAWAVTGPDADPMDPATVRSHRMRGFDSLVCLTRSLSDHGAGDVRITVVADHLHDVDGSELVSPGKAGVLGACLVIGQEYPGFTCRTVDVGPRQAAHADATAQRLMGELAAPEPLAVAYRGGARLIQSYTPMAPPAGDAVLRDGGVYLITGGLGNVGMLVAGHLAATVRAPRLVLVGRRGLPPRAQWRELVEAEPGSEVSRRISRLLAIEELGATVLVLAAEGGEPDRVQSAVQVALQRFGVVNGVVHAAGLTTAEHFQPIQTMSAANIEAHFHAKVDSLLAVERALAGQPVDFWVLFSSISTVLGGLGFAAYAAANAVLDSFAALRSGARWTSVNWDTWRSTADQLDTGGLANIGGLGGSMTEFAMTVPEGLDAFDRVLAAGAPRVVVSAGELAARLRQWVSGAGADRVGDGLAPLFPRPELAEMYVPATSEYERRLVTLWRETLGIEQVGVNDNFFDLGGNSLMGLQLLKRIGHEFDINVPAVALFQAPTVTALARYLASGKGPRGDHRQDPGTDSDDQRGGAAELHRRRQLARRSARADTDEVAVIGLAGRFPGAADVDQFWHNLRDGVEAIRFFTDDELIAAGVPAEQVGLPNYVKARPVLDDVDLFDAAFFGYSPREATLTDPQQRVFLECCWHALENAGYAGSSYPGSVGVFAGTNISTYLRRLYEAGDLGGVNDYQVVIGNDKDSLTTAVSYKLNLTGPSLAVQTFCSTSLVAVHLASQSLRGGECDIALAGGVSIRVPDRVGHVYLEGGMESPDGHVRTFDARARGSMFGDGAGVVVLKRLADAVADGDTVHAVIKGSAVNNDGSLKVGFTAPSVVGQAEVVTRALADAGVGPETISYLEAHGTATELGDPIEMAALTRAFDAAGGTRSGGTQYCAIGSVKTNVGHLDRAAGVSGLIKVVLALRHGEIPPSLHFTEPNPEIDFENSPFYVNTRRTEWTSPPGVPRRAGVNSLGMGGTNVHVVIEQAPQRAPAGAGRAQQLLVLSARTATALAEATADLARHLRESPDAELADVAYTLQVGRGCFEHRTLVRCGRVADAITALEGADPARVLTRHEPRTERPVGLLFAGVGEQYPGMAADLYETEPVFRSALDECVAVLDPLLGLDLRQVLCAGGPANAGQDTDLRALLGRGAASQPCAAADVLTRTAIAQPAVFAVEYALARLLTSWGLRPDAMAGYSVGEYVAATLAGVLTLPDALALVAYRAGLIEPLPGGAMLAVSLPADQVRALLDSGIDIGGADIGGVDIGSVDIAAVNAPDQCVLAGPPEAIAGLMHRLAERDIACRRLDTTHAFHSSLLAPVADELTTWVARNVTLSPPRLPYVSNVTGTWITPEEATDPGYWARHMCGTVRFADAVGTLLADPDRMLIEVGPGQSLGAFVRRHPDCSPRRMALIIPTLPARHERMTASEVVHAAQGKLWLAGASVDWDAYHAGERRHRIPLPGYPFQRERYWMDEPGPAARIPAALITAPRQAGAPVVDLTGNPRDILTSLPRKELDHWYYLPSWHQAVPPPSSPLSAEGPWLVFADRAGVADAVAERLAAAGARVARVLAGDGFTTTDDDAYTVAVNEPEDYAKVVDRVRPRYVLHLWSLDEPPASCSTAQASEWTIACGYSSLLWLSQALGRTGAECELIVASARACNVTGQDEVRPERATVAGPCKVIPLEMAAVTCRQVDVCQPATAEQADVVAGQLLGERCADPSHIQVAWRGGRRWLPGFEPLPAPAHSDGPGPLRERGVYLITGGLGGIGLAIARGLAAAVSARLVLVGRSEPPPRTQWPALLADPRTPDELRRRIEAVGDLESAGAEVLICTADVADPESLRAAIAAAVDRFGAVHGVVHTAGVPGMGLLQFKNHDNAAIALRPKIAGTRVLLDCLAGLELDFLALFSSITAVTGGGPGQVDYCAANTYLDAVAQRAGVRGGPRVISINWGEWRWNAWGAGLSGYAPEVQQFFADNRSKVGISFEEGWQAFLGAVSSNEPQLIVSPQDFPVLAELSRTFTIETVLSLGLESRGSHPRPELGTSYVAPGTDLERRIAAIWSEALGITDVGVHDNFFELGGNSLLGVDLVARLRRELKQDGLAPHVLYLAPTVAALAELAAGVDQGALMDDRRERGALRRQSLRTRRNR